MKLWIKNHKEDIAITALVSGLLVMTAATLKTGIDANHKQKEQDPEWVSIFEAKTGITIP